MTDDSLFSYQYRTQPVICVTETCLLLLPILVFVSYTKADDKGVCLPIRRTY